MKIAILTSGILPVPAVQGGAVENLIDFYLDYNNIYKLHDITIYSIKDPKTNKHKATLSNVNHYYYIDTNSILGKIRKWLYLKNNGRNEYYHYSIEFFLERAIQHIKKKSYDVIIIENRPGYTIKVKNATNATLVIHQGNDFLNNRVKNSKEIYDFASIIINTSDYITNCVKTIDSTGVKCKTVLNGIDTNKFYNSKALERNMLGLTDKDFVVVYSGRLTREKGILELIQSLIPLKNYSCIKLLILGASFYGNDKKPTPFIKELTDISSAIRDKVIYTGYIDYSKIPSYLKMADIAVVPSVWDEPFGLTVVEAMAAGLPLITTRSGGIPEICEGVATIIERNDIVNNLTTSILDLYNHPKKRKEMATASLERSKLFDKETFSRDFFAALEAIQ